MTRFLKGSEVLVVQAGNPHRGSQPIPGFSPGLSDSVLAVISLWSAGVCMGFPPHLCYGPRAAWKYNTASWVYSAVSVMKVTKSRSNVSKAGCL